MFIVDGHLDLAHNAMHGRDVLRPAADQTPDEDGIPCVGIPDLRAAPVSLFCGTIFCEPAHNGKPGYRTTDEAHTAARQQADWYAARHRDATLRVVRDSAQLPVDSSHLNTILLMEGADPIRNPGEVTFWWDAGIRIVGLAWRQTHYAGGTGCPGPLTSAGIELVRELDQFGIIHDVSHLAEESFWQLLDLTSNPLIASHSNCRAIIPTDRQLSDEMIRALAARGAVIGINFYDRFLLPPDQYGQRRAKLDDVIRHINHICDVIGDTRHVALGTDMDGGLGQEQIPSEIHTSADLPHVADALRRAAYTETQITDIMGLNWLRFFTRHLPKTTASA
jgi:membrane dipeptidase